MGYLLSNIDTLLIMFGYVPIIYSVFLIISAFKTFYSNQKLIKEYAKFKEKYHLDEDYYIDPNLNYNRVISALVCIMGILIVSIAMLKYPIMKMPDVDSGISLFMKLAIGYVTVEMDINEISIYKGILCICLIIGCPFLVTGVW